MTRLEDLTGRKFNMLTAVSLCWGRNGAGKRTKWLCNCECGGQVEVVSSKLKNGHTKSCGCLRDHKGRNSGFRGGYEEISGTRWNYVFKQDSKRQYRRNYPFTITIEYIWDLFERQKRKCALSGVPIYFGKKRRDHSTASLDRIDSTLGYIPGNVQWVHKDINMMKNKHPQDYFIQMCKQVAENNK